MPSISVLPGQAGVSRAVARISCSLRGRSPGGADRAAAPGLAGAWRSLLGGVTPRAAATGAWVAASGGTFARGMAAAAGEGAAAAAAPPPDGPRVCILGGGFGGLYTAVKLENLFWTRGTKPRVTLIDQADRFTFKPLLYELLSGAATADEVAPSYAQLLAPYPVTFVQGRVAAVKPGGDASCAGAGAPSDGGGTVVLDSGEALPYDWLVLALGAETNTFGVPGVKEHALAFSTYQDAERVRERLEALDAGGAGFPEVVVVGGGYAGVELAAAVAERLRGRGRIQLVTSGADVLPRAPQGQREAARAALADDGVGIVAGAAVTEVRAAATAAGGDAAAAKRLVYLRDSEGQAEILEADMVLWAAGQAPAPRLAPSRLALPFPVDDATGATRTDATLRVVDHRRVFALGDVAVAGPPGEAPRGGAPAEPLPATAQVAFQQADYVAWNIWASINGRPLLRFSYQHLGDMMSLGAGRGAVTMPIPVPPPLSAAAQAGPLGEVLRLAGVKVNTTFGGASDGVTLEGPLAALVRRAAYLYRQPTDGQRARVAVSWAEQATKAAAELARRVLVGGDKPAGGGGSA